MRSQSRRRFYRLEKNDASAALALIYARTGEADEAIKLIEKVWDPLRNDPRFQKILEGPEPKTIY